MQKKRADELAVETSFLTAIFFGFIYRSQLGKIRERRFFDKTV
jgi:hypothetical protein